MAERWYPQASVPSNLFLWVAQGSHLCVSRQRHRLQTCATKAGAHKFNNVDGTLVLESMR